MIQTNPRSNSEFNLPLPPLLIILIGLPASGKSTVARLLLPMITKIYPKTCIIDTDLIRTTLFGNKFVPENEQAVLIEKNIQVQSHLLPNQAIIVDDMHYFVAVRHKLYESSQSIRAIYVSIHISTPIDTCILWNKARGEPIPNAIIPIIASKFDIPGKKYRWDIPYIVFNPEIMVFAQKEQEYFSLFQQKIKKAMPRSSKSKKASFQAKIIASELDLSARKLIGEIICHKIASDSYREIIEDLHRIKQQQVEPKALGHVLSTFHKSYLKWLVNESLPAATLDNFVRFLKSQ